MRPRIDPTVFEDAMTITGSRSLDELGWKFLGVTGNTARSYYKGETVPSIKVAVILAKITSRRIEDILMADSIAAA